MGYFASLIVISMAAALACLLIPDENSPSGKLLRLASSLCVLAVALSPIVTAKEQIVELFDSFGAYVESLAGNESALDTDSAVGRELSRHLTELVCERFSLGTDRVKVAVTLDTSDESSPTLTHVRVSVVNGENTPDINDVNAYISELTGVSAQTVILSPGIP